MAYIKKNKPKNYLNNKDMMEQIRLSKEQGRMTEELGKMCIALVQRYAMSPNYASIYSYKEDMEAHAIMTLARAWAYFNPDKSNNPFAYFTQVAKHSFYQYLNHEKKLRETSMALAVDLGVSNQETEGEFYNDLAAAFGNEPEAPSETTHEDEE